MSDPILYPLTLFKGDETRVAEHETEHAALRGEGWQTADERVTLEAPVAEPVAEPAEDAAPEVAEEPAPEPESKPKRRKAKK